MADLKISQLTGATTPLAGTEVLPIVQSSATVKVSVANLTAGRDISVAKLTASDNVVISTAGKGIDFSANTHAAGMTSELLTWYEQGTWTPANVSMTVVSGVWAANGTYTRIGNIVYWTVNQTSGTVSANSTQALVSGLPFTPAAQSPGTITNSGGSIGGVVVVETNNYVYSGLTFASQTTLRISGFYKV